MYQRAVRSLFIAATLILTTTACDKGGGDKADKKTDAKTDKEVEAETGEAAAEAGEPAVETGEVASPTETGEATAEAGEAATETGGETDEVAAEAGEDAREPASGDEGGDKNGGDKSGGDKGGGDKGGGDKTASGPKIDGKPIFKKKCKTCHGLDGKGDTTIGKKVDIPSLAKTKMSKGKIIKTITNGVPDTKMKAYKSKLSKDEIEAVAIYVKKL